ncbi:MAG: ATP phosphoribosyltransferase [Promethearchaeota archaeon]
MPKLKFAIPKGSLQEGTLKLLRQAGYNIAGGKRSYRPSINDSEIELKILRPQEIPTMLSQGAHDIGISGQDWVLETSADVVNLLNLEYGFVRLVLAVPEDWTEINNLSALLRRQKEKNKPLRIFTEYLKTSSEYIQNNNTFQSYYPNKIPDIITPWHKYEVQFLFDYGDDSQEMRSFKESKNSMMFDPGDDAPEFRRLKYKQINKITPDVKIILSFGATEAKPPEDAEAIIDVIETGTTLTENNLKIIDIVGESNAYLLGNKDALRDRWKREKIKDVMVLLKGVVEARKKVHVFMNIKTENIPKLLGKLPALKRPTVSPLAGIDGWSALNTIISKDLFLHLIPELRKYAQGIVVEECRQILPFELEELNNVNLNGEKAE